MQSHPRLARRFLLGAVLAVCATGALPQGATLYTVEVVVFRNGGDAAAMASTATAPAVSDDVEITPAATGKLNSAAAKLRSQSSGFKVLAHKAWTQVPTAWDSGRGPSATQVGLGNGIDGRVSLERSSTYPLNLRLDVTVEDGGRRFRISEVHRNVKVGQIHYFDHPAFGVLAIVTATTG
jgi:hypothetical protein